jgi:hypothetical protein
LAGAGFDFLVLVLIHASVYRSPRRVKRDIWFETGLKSGRIGTQPLEPALGDG